MGQEITPSMQEYLTAMYKRDGHIKWVRTTDVAEDLKIAAASVTEAFKKLAELGYIEYLPYRGAKLTPKGLMVAKSVASKERAIREALIMMGVRAEEADRVACILEHVISDEAVSAIIAYVGRCGGGSTGGKG